jgi:hypothetical protein
MTLESLWNTRKLTDEPYNWLTKTAAPPWVIHLARHSYLTAHLHALVECVPCTLGVSYH